MTGCDPIGRNASKKQASLPAREQNQFRTEQIEGGPPKPGWWLATAASRIRMSQAATRAPALTCFSS